MLRPHIHEHLVGTHIEFNYSRVFYTRSHHSNRFLNSQMEAAQTRHPVINGREFRGTQVAFHSLFATDTQPSPLDTKYDENPDAP